MRITDKYVLFWETCFSNFFPCKIKYDDSIFLSSEHLFMYFKATFFDDKDIANQIIKAGTPKAAKALGRQVKNFNELEWELFREEYMEVAVYEKFKQHPELQEELLNKKYLGRRFVEASPLDKIWGIGLHYDDLLCDQSDNWQGLNLLGKVLNKVRATLLNDSASFTFARKPQKCPACGAKRIVPILYGEPMEYLMREAEEGKIILGGCCVTNFDPDWGCVDCRAELYKK